MANNFDPSTSLVFQKSQAINQLLVDLCAKGDLDAVTKHIDSNLAFNQLDYNDYAALKASIREHHPNIIRYLVSKFPRELSDQLLPLLRGEIRAGNTRNALMLLDSAFGYGADRIALILQTAGEVGNEEVINFIMAGPMAVSHNKNIFLTAAICGALRCGKPGLLRTLVPKLEENNDPKQIQTFYWSILVRAAQIENDDIFAEVLGVVAAKLIFDSVDPVTYYELTPTFSTISKSDALFVIIKYCCRSQSSRSINSIIATFGSNIEHGLRYSSCMEDICRNGHLDAAKFFTDRYRFATLPQLIKFAIASDQASILAFFYHKYGHDVVFNAGPEQHDHINRLLHRHFMELASQFSPGTAGGP